MLTSRVAPDSTDEARAACKEGTVKLSLVVDEHGVPRDIRVIRPLDSGLDTKAVQAVTQWRFRPGMRGGRPVSTKATVEVNFRSLECTPSGHMLVETSGKLGMTQPPAAGVLSKKDTALGVEVLQVAWSNSTSSANGVGHANLLRENREQGFDFTSSCARPFVPNETSGSYPARWKKPDTRLVIETVEVGNPKKHRLCELKISLQPFIYGLRGAQLVTVPLR